jgi:hypothetical protein
VKILVRLATLVLNLTWGAVIVGFVVSQVSLQPIHWAAGDAYTAPVMTRTIQSAPCPPWAVTLGRWGTAVAGSYSGSGSTGKWLQAKPHSWSETLSWPGADYICGYVPGAKARYARQEAMP